MTHPRGCQVVLSAILLLLPAGAHAEIPAAERAALIALYRSTGGDWWKNSTNWLSERERKPADSGTECEWYGVTCDSDEFHVTALELKSNNLLGHLPAEIGALSSLESLVLADNRLTGELPNGIWRLRGLEVLDLSGNQLRGRLNASVGELRELRKLLLSINRLSGPVPATIANCPDLEELDLSANRFSGSIPSELGSLQEIRSLDLSRNQLSGSLPARLGRLEKATTILLAGNRLTGRIPPSWSRLKDIYQLDLSGNSLGGSVAPWLFDLPSLSILILKDNRFTGTLKVGASSEVNMLDASGNLLSGAVPPDLGRLEGLQQLILNRNALTGAIPGTLFTNDSLRLLNLAHNKLTGRLPAEGRLPNFTDLSFNELAGNIPPDLISPGLQSLSLSNNQLTGEIPAAIWDSDVSRLDLSHNRLTGGLPQEIDDSALQIVSLADNALEGTLPSNIFDNRELLWLDVSGNRLSGPVPTITRATSIQVLQLAHNDFSGRLQIRAEDAPWLAWLTLNQNRLTAASLLEIAILPSLIAFDGTGNPWSEPVPPAIASLAPRPPPSFVVLDRSTLVEPVVSQPESERAVESETGSPSARRTNQSPVTVRYPPLSANNRFDRPGVRVVRAAWSETATAASQGISIRGTVTDQESAAFPGVTVTAVGPDGTVHQTTTDASGAFVVNVPRPGEYRIKVDVAGFKTTEKVVRATVGQSATVSLVVQIGSLLETVTVSAGTRPDAAWWNSFVSEEDRESEIPEHLVVGGRYQFVLEVGSSKGPTGPNRQSVPLSGQLRKLIRLLVQRGRPTLPLSIRFFVVGRPLRFSRQTESVAEWRDGRWVYVVRQPNFALLRLDLRRMLTTVETPPFSGSLPDDNYRFGGVRLDVEAVQPGCAAIAASIWDDADQMPLDQVVQIVSVGGGTECEDYQGGAGLPADAFSSGRDYTQAGAALQVFEFRVGGVPAAVALLAAKSPREGCTHYAWRLNGTISGAVFQDQFRAFVREARDSEAQTEAKYRDLAGLLRDALFKGTAPNPQCGPARALAELQAAAASANVEVLVRVVNAEGRNVYPPLGLLSLASDPTTGAALFRHRLLPVQPLTRQSLGASDCVSGWTLVLPEMLKDADAGALMLPASLENYSGLVRTRDGFLKAIEALDAGRPSGVVLLAHHAEGYLKFENDKAVGAASLKDTNLGNGSVGIISACMGAEITDSALLVENLNADGFDALLMSPFDVDLSFGIALAKNVAEEIVKLQSEGGTTTLGRLYREAMTKTEKDFEPYGIGAAGRALEFVLAGNPNVRICPRPRPGG